MPSQDTTLDPPPSSDLENEQSSIPSRDDLTSFN
jgi:hypothetical protein